MESGPAAAHSTGLGRNFRLYATGRAVSVVGDRIALITLLFLIIRDAHGAAAPAAVALFYACRGAPTLLGGLIAGVIVDHFNRRRVMLGCDLARAVIFAAIPLAAASRVPLLLVLVFVIYALTLLFNTSVQAALPDVVPELRMLRANAILNSISTAADLGYAVGGGLVVALGYVVPLYFDAATFLFSFAMISLVRFPSPPSPPLPDLGAVLARIGGGLRYTADTPFLRWTSITFFVSPLAGGAALVLGPLYAERVLRHSPWLFGPLKGGIVRFSVLEVAIGVGALAGASLVGPLAERVGRGTLIGLGVAGTGLADLPLAVTSNMAVATAAMVASGLCTSLGAIPAFTLVQQLTPTEMRGRVVAARLSLINGALALGSLLGGALLAFLSFRAAWTVEAAVIVGGSLFSWIPNAVRRRR